jgi:hypothetical protein
MTGVAMLLLALGAILLVAALGTVVIAPLVASRAAAVASKPRLERRASGPDRMRALITAQREERTRTRGLSTVLTRTGVVLAVMSVLSLLGGAVAWATGY